MNDNYLPIGSVVILKEATKRIMITGFCVKSTSENGKTYDYIGVVSPEGFVSNDKMLLFNNDQINQIIFKGLEDQEEKEFKEKLKKLTDVLKSF